MIFVADFDFFYIHNLYVLMTLIFLF